MSKNFPKTNNNMNTGSAVLYTRRTGLKASSKSYLHVQIRLPLGNESFYHADQKKSKNRIIFKSQKMPL